jgi:hypothetical protein
LSGGEAVVHIQLLQLWLARERPKWRRFKGTALMPSRSCRIRPMRRWS